jgi:endonuclease/exonuclease/phosphatase family metal-dependent hydrolase
MRFNLLTRPCQVDKQEITEPTLLALFLVVFAFVVLLFLCAVTIAGLPAFGYMGWSMTALAAILLGLLWSLRRKANANSTPPTSRQKWMQRIVQGARLAFIGVFGSWLGLYVWLALCEGGPAPPPKANSALIRVVTWNIHCGQEYGVPWKQFDWPTRKHALRAALEQAQPDILCVQEATPEQVNFLEEILPGHGRVGVGRDDGKSGGEHCAIYFARERFEEIKGSTFWLEEPIDQPRVGSALDIKRICTWVRLRDRTNKRTFRVYNTHLYLTEAPNMTAAKLILDQIAADDQADAVLLTADFNASPSSPSRRLFSQRGLMDSAERAGKPVGKATFQLYGIGLSCIDGILVDHQWHVDNFLLLDVKPLNTFPSDHFAILADIALRDLL